MKHTIAKLFLPLLFLFNLTGFAQGTTCNDFVRIDGKKFKCGTTDYFAVVTNYLTVLFHSTGTSGSTSATHFPARYHGYCPDNMVGPEISDASSAYSIMVKDFTDMKNKGFNAVRVVGATEFDGSITSWNPSGNDPQVLD